MNGVERVRDGGDGRSGDDRGNEERGGDHGVGGEEGRGEGEKEVVRGYMEMRK